MYKGIYSNTSSREEGVAMQVATQGSSEHPGMLHGPYEMYPGGTCLWSLRISPMPLHRCSRLTSTRALLTVPTTSIECLHCYQYAVYSRGSCLRSEHTAIKMCYSGDMFTVGWIIYAL